MESNSFRAWTVPTAVAPETISEALKWMGIEHGRATEYRRLCEEFAKGKTSRMHFFIYNESCEIIDIYSAWKDKIVNFPGLEAKIRAVFVKGHVLREMENHKTSSNRSRNDAFVYVVAGKLLHVPNVTLLSVDSIPNRTIQEAMTENLSNDIVMRLNGLIVKVECKRPMKAVSLNGNVKKAVKQLEKDKDCAGIVAADLSRSIREDYQYLEASVVRKASDFISSEVQKLLMPYARAFKGENLLGFIGFARVPLVTPVQSAILQSDGQPYAWQVRINSALCFLLIKNSLCSHGDVMEYFSTQLSRTQYDIPPSGRPLV